jgi:hypothetical protein
MLNACLASRGALLMDTARLPTRHVRVFNGMDMAFFPASHNAVRVKKPPD